MPAHVSSLRGNSAAKAERLEARVTSEQKRLLQRAANLRGRSLSDFVIGAAQDAALRTVQEFGVITLSARDQQAFVEALRKPPAPNDKLRSAWKRYQKHARP